VSAETALAKALRILDDLPDAELIEVASVIEEDAKRALERRDRARGALLRRMHAHNAKALADGDGSIAVELGEKRVYEWDGDALADAIGERDREKFLKWVEPQPGRWAPKSVVSINNLIDKLGDDPKAKRLASARKVAVTEYIKFVEQA
jgi:hypothetical protein